MSSTSPDYCIVRFTLLGTAYTYRGSSKKLLITSGDDVDTKELIERQLAMMPLHHIPADVQIQQALTMLGFKKFMPVITYAKKQPKDNTPADAIS
jgi:hypothetical protein